MKFGLNFGLSKKGGAAPPTTFLRKLGTEFPGVANGELSASPGEIPVNSVSIIFFSQWSASGVDEAALIESFNGFNLRLTQVSNPANFCNVTAASIIFPNPDYALQQPSGNMVFSIEFPPLGEEVLWEIPPPPFSVLCPGDLSVPIGSPQASIDAVWAAWLDGFGIDEAGCLPSGNTLTSSPPGFPIPSSAGGSTTVFNNGVDDCGQVDSCQSIFNVN